MVPFLFYAFILLILSLWIFLLHCKRRPLNATVAPPSSGGLDTSAIEALPSFKFAASGLALPSNSNYCSDCVVCLGPFEDDETLRFIPDCGHVFHSFCVDVWLRSRATCPCCRAPVVPVPGGQVGDSGSSSAALEGGGVVVMVEDAC